MIATDSTDTAAEPPLYPLALKLDGAAVLVVGGGTLALHKTRDLVDCGARVHVVAPEWRADFSDLRDSARGVRLSTRAFADADLDGAVLAIAATDDRGVQERVAAGARRRGLLVNVVDVPDLCTVYVPAILRRGDLTVAVSTAGRSPLLAGAVRDLVARQIDPSIARGLARLGEARAAVHERFPEGYAERKAALVRLVTPEAVADLVEGRIEAFETRYREWRTCLGA